MLSERSRARSRFSLSRSELRFSGSETEDPGSEEILQDGGGVRGYGWELGSAGKGVGPSQNSDRPSQN